jgi:hypothetical protein
MVSMIKRLTTKALRELAQADENDDALCALDFAESNASETSGIVDEAHWEQVAYDSIAWTAPFQENAAVRDWYEAQGYRW